MITHHNPKSPVAEAYRTLRTNITFSALDKPFRTLMVTSAGPEEGKSTTLANLAIAMAQAGSRILVVDCDLRKPLQHKIFSLSNRQGVTNLLVENLDAEQVIQSSVVPNLDVLTSGPIPPNPSELLGSKRMQSLLPRLVERYDCVLLDTPPAVAVTDAAVLAPHVDGVILVIRAGVAKIEMLKEAKSLLDNANARIIGTVLNGVKYDGDDYQYYYYYGERKKRKPKPGGQDD
ncbi:MAG: CpsD/CapB family tyrosine-protein kinase [Firmicutes bacterium]|nr:CpsD/CapB family tyrosine-protein kinase [Bacillota bacterium]